MLVCLDRASSPQEGADLQGTIEEVLAAAIEDGLDRGRDHRRQRSAEPGPVGACAKTCQRSSAYEGGSIKHDVAVPVSRVAEFIEAATQACEAAMPGIRVCAFGHFGDGNIHFNLSQPVAMDKDGFPRRNGSGSTASCTTSCNGMNGSIAAEHGIGLIKRDELRLYKDPVALDLMRAIKHTLDPHNLLNPGKVVSRSETTDPALLSRRRTASRTAATGQPRMKTIDILAIGEPLMEFAHVERAGERLYLPGYGGDVSNAAVAAARQGAKAASSPLWAAIPFGADFLKLWDREASIGLR